MFDVVEQLTNLNRILMMHGNLVSAGIAEWKKYGWAQKVKVKILAHTEVFQL